MKPMPMMACGCVAQGHRVDEGERVPFCLTHMTAEQAPMPDFTGRRARCTYNPGRCKSEQDSRPNLPFFKHKPAAPFDEFYCGCFGWD